MPTPKKTTDLIRFMVDSTDTRKPAITALQLGQLQQRLQEVACKDRYRLEMEYAALKANLNSPKWPQWLNRLEQSLLFVHQRQQNLPKIEYPDLPVSEQSEHIVELIRQHPVVIVAGETGSGKTTQLPKICLQAGRGIRGLIGHTQPRRIAARSVATRIAEELHSPLGEAVGYQVRFTDQTSPNSYLKLMTDGILLAEIQHDRFLNQYDTIIIDEAHERSLNIDFLLGYLKQILPKRPDLKVVITSATIDVEKFSKHFNDAPIVSVSGRTYPVDIEYRPPLESDEDIYQAIVSTIDEIRQLRHGGDILVFCNGEGEIREAALAIKRAQFPQLSVLPLYARLSLQDQAKVFSPNKLGQRVILATNVAETSITVPGIRYVIDTGRARISRYSYRTKVQRLPIEPISQASANQRAGRCGRLSDGVCYRLYSEDDFNNRPEFTDPEIVRTNLAAVILKMLHMRIGDINRFPFVDAPDNRMINDGFKLLEELQAVSKKGSLTAIGKQLIPMPVDPRIGRMLIAARQENCVKEMLIIAAAMSIQDPRERPADKRQAADEKHRQWQDKSSDFVAYLNLWQHMEQQRQELSRNQYSQYCHKHFLSYLRMREWRELHHQLHGVCRDLGLKQQSQPATPEAIHRALLAGLLSNVATRDEDKQFEGTRNRKLMIFPGSALAKKPPKWIVAAEMLETSRLFATTVAEIDPAWLPELAAHLVKKSYSEPHYNVRAGQVMAYEKQTLFGLAIVERKRVPYGKKDLKVAHDIFVQQALVEEGYRGKGAFFKHNQALVAELHELESRFRKRDLLSDDRVLFEFYSQRVPESISDLVSFETWRKQAEQQQPKLLYFTKELLLRRELAEDETAQFPKQISWQGITYPLHYHFEPNTVDDGLSVQVPVAILHQLPNHRFDWLVPGMLRDKCIALIKQLPKSVRRQFVPVPDYVDKALPSMKPDNQPVWQSLALQLKRISGVDIDPTHWQQSQLDAWFRPNFKLVDEQDGLLAQSRDLEQLRQQFKNRIKKGLQQHKQTAITQKGLTEWNFGDLPHVITLDQSGVKVTAWPAIEDKVHSVDISLQDNPLVAERITQQGVCRLLRLTKKEPEKYLQKQAFKQSALAVAGSGFKKEMLVEELIQGAYWQVLKTASEGIVRQQTLFETISEQSVSKIVPLATEMEQLLIEQFKILVDIRKALKKAPFNAVFAVEDINRQLDELYSAGYLRYTAVDQLRQYHRYLKAIQIRLEKLSFNLAKDRAALAELEQYRQFIASVDQPDYLPNTLFEQYQQLKTMVQEYRVSLFAQQLKTAFPISGKRIQQHWQTFKVAHEQHLQR